MLNGLHVFCAVLAFSPQETGSANPSCGPSPHRPQRVRQQRSDGVAQLERADYQGLGKSIGRYAGIANHQVKVLCSSGPLELQRPAAVEYQEMLHGPCAVPGGKLHGTGTQGVVPVMLKNIPDLLRPRHALMEGLEILPAVNAQVHAAMCTARLRAMDDSREHDVAPIAKAFGVSRTSAYRAVGRPPES